MLERQKRLVEVYEYLRSHYGVHTQVDFAAAVGASRAVVSSALNGNPQYLTDKMFQKICAAFPGVFNLDYLLTGEGELLASSEQQPTQPTAPDYQRELIESLKARIDDKDREIAYLRSVIDRLHNRLGVSQQWDTTRASFMVSDELQPPAPDK